MAGILPGPQLQQKGWNMDQACKKIWIMEQDDKWYELWNDEAVNIISKAALLPWHPLSQTYVMHNHHQDI